MIANHLVGAATTNMATASAGTVVVAMTDSVLVSIVGQIVILITGIVTVYFAYKAKQISTEAKEVSQQTGRAVNGKMEEFKKMAEEFYHAKGMADEKVSAESKAGVEAIAKAAGKAESKAESVVQPVAATPPPPKV